MTLGFPLATRTPRPKVAVPSSHGSPLTLCRLIGQIAMLATMLGFTTVAAPAAQSSRTSAISPSVDASAAKQSEHPERPPTSAIWRSSQAKNDLGTANVRSPVTGLPMPRNHFVNLNDGRRNWLPAAVPPTPAEIQAHPGLFLEGNWHIQWRGHPEFESANIWIVNGLKLGSDCSLEGAYESCRDPAEPPTLHSGPGARVHGGRTVGHAYTIKVSPDGSQFQVEHQGSTDGPFSSILRRKPGVPDVLAGRWKNSDGKSGAEIWRREPRPRVSRVECRYGKVLTVGTATQPCTIVVPSYPGKDAMRGNLPGLTIDIFGSNMRGAGPLPVFLDWDKTKLEVNYYCYLYEKPFSADEPHGCASWGDPSDTYGEIIGLRAGINVVYGARAGLRTLWIGGRPVPFELRLPNLPKAMQRQAPDVIHEVET